MKKNLLNNSTQRRNNPSQIKNKKNEFESTVQILNSS